MSRGASTWRLRGESTASPLGAAFLTLRVVPTTGAFSCLKRLAGLAPLPRLAGLAFLRSRFSGWRDGLAPLAPLKDLAPFTPLKVFAPLAPLKDFALLPGLPPLVAGALRVGLFFFMVFVIAI